MTNSLFIPSIIYHPVLCWLHSDVVFPECRHNKINNSELSELPRFCSQCWLGQTTEGESRGKERAVAGAGPHELENGGGEVGTVGI